MDFKNNQAKIMDLKKYDLVMMIGIPGSGKSHFAASLALDGWQVVSSDAVRAELYGDENIQGDPIKVFEEVHARIFALLQEGYRVVFDATNISSKRRKDFLNVVPLKYRVLGVHMSLPLEVCIERNFLRDRRVPEEVIRKQFASLEPPLLSEGFHATMTILRQ